MWQTVETRTAKAAREAVWAAWSDAGSWKLWDPGVEYASLSGEFREGTLGVLKAVGGPRSKFTIVEATVGRSFTNRARLPLCTLDFIHEVEDIPEGVAITHRVIIRGLLAPLFARVAGRAQEKNLPRAVEALARMAEMSKFAG